MTMGVQTKHTPDHPQGWLLNNNSLYHYENITFSIKESLFCLGAIAIDGISITQS
jgi:hypothetical protein